LYDDYVVSLACNFHTACQLVPVLTELECLHVSEIFGTNSVC